MARTEMTLRDLITNPPGFNTRQVAARYTIRDALRAKFVAAMADPLRRRRFKMSVSGGDSKYVVWVKVPSETYDVVYDVVLQLSVPEGVRTISGADVRVYCNSPSFVFVQGFAMNHAGLLADGWAPALGRAATEPPSIVNANEDIGFDKVVYQGILFATGPGGLVSIRDLESSPKGPPPKPSDNTLSAEYKLLQYRRAKDKYDAAKRLVKRAEKRTKEDEAKKARMETQAKKGAAKLAKTSATAKRVRQAANAAGKKSRSTK